MHIHTTHAHTHSLSPTHIYSYIQHLHSHTNTHTNTQHTQLHTHIHLHRQTLTNPHPPTLSHTEHIPTHPPPPSQTYSYTQSQWCCSKPPYIPREEIPDIQNPPTSCLQNATSCGYYSRCYSAWEERRRYSGFIVYVVVLRLFMWCSWVCYFNCNIDVEILVTILLFL